MRPNCKVGNREAARAMRDAGMKLQEIGDALGLSRQRVDQMLNPEKWLARAAAWRARNRGELAKPRRCEACNRGRRKLEMHHSDHADRLGITWLCRSCHVAETTKERKARQAA